MGVAVTSGRIGYVVLSPDFKLIDWGVSRVACQTPETAAAKVLEWIELLYPGAVVTERVGSNARKRGKTLDLMKAVYRSVQDSDVISVTTTKVRHHKDKYREARVLAEEFPELLNLVPNKPACWLNRPKSMILFEALAIALRLRETW